MTTKIEHWQKFQHPETRIKHEKIDAVGLLARMTNLPAEPEEGFPLGENSSYETRKEVYLAAKQNVGRAIAERLPGNKSERAKQRVGEYIVGLLPVPYFFALLYGKDENGKFYPLPEKITYIMKTARAYDPRCYGAAMAALEVPVPKANPDIKQEFARKMGLAPVRVEVGDEPGMGY